MQKKDKDKIKYLDRLEKVNKIKEFEAEGGEKFFQDVEDDPPFPPLNPDKVDFFQKKLSSKIKTLIARFMVWRLKRYATKRFEIEVEGAENLQNIASGAVITTNHFSQYESLCVMKALDKAKEKRRMHIIVREGNFFMPGGVGFILKHLYTIPLLSSMSGMRKTLKAISQTLADKKFIMVYPEQSMWWNYRKPKRFKAGAFNIAAKNNVPIVPCFVTMKNIAGLDDCGFPNQKYTIHVMPPIYKDENKSDVENTDEMMKKNYEMWVAKYEEVYGVKLAYDGKNFCND